MMAKKKPLILRPYHKTRYAYEKLRICKHCRFFTVLWEDRCANCGREALIPVMQQARIQAKRSMQNERLIALLITLAAVLFSQTLLQIILCLAGGILLTGLLWWFQRKMIESETPEAARKAAAKQPTPDHRRHLYEFDDGFGRH
ncbi:hypothetical protein VQ056_06225 [Paenibacillus sp. JTLBN-2024]